MVSIDYAGTQEWPIAVPAEPPHDHRLEARDANGATRAHWEWGEHDDQCWVGLGAPESFYAIVAICAEHGWSLRSVRVVDPIDAGTAAMVAKQIESHITLPAFIHKSCQFENVTDGGKEEWRAIFRAALEAYKAAGGAA